MAAIAELCRRKEACEGENQFLTHHTLEISDDQGQPIGTALVSLYDAARAEKLNAATRFLTQPGSYLANYAMYLFDTKSIVCKLPELIRFDLPDGTARVLLIDDIIFEGFPPTIKGFCDSVQQLMRLFQEDADIMLLPQWPIMASRIGYSATDVMERLSMIGITPIDALTLIGFMEDLSVFPAGTLNY